MNKDYEEFKAQNEDAAEIFMQAYYLQTKLRIPMPDITPTPFGITVHKNILQSKIKGQDTGNVQN
jgi:hypothetical protein